MFHLDNNSGVSAMPPVGTVQSSAPRWFTEGGGGTPASYPGAAWYNIIQAELLNFLSAYGIAPDKADLSQLRKAIEAAIKDKATAKSPLLTAIAGLVTSADKMPYFNGKDTVAMTALTAFAREVLAQTDAAGVLSKLGLGEDAKLSGNLTVKGGFWDTAPGNTPQRVWSPNNKPSLNDMGVVDSTTTVKGIVELATNAEMATGSSQSLVPSVSAVMSIFSKRSFSANDYVRIPDVPGGLIIQWVSGNASASGVFFAQMPIPFPNKLLFAGAIEAGANVWGTDSATTWGIDFANSSLSQVIAYARRIFPTTVTQEAAAGLVIAIGN